MILSPETRSELTLVAVTMGAKVASRAVVAAIEKVEKGNEVPIPVPAVKISRPNLT